MAGAKSAGVSKSQEIRNYLAENQGAAAKDVVAALGARGITVSEGLVNNVKSTSRKRGGKRRVKVRRGRGRGGVNKSESIRGYLAEHPSATPKQIEQALGEQGITVSAGLISVVKYGKGTGGGRKKLVARRGSDGARAATTSLSAEDLFAVKSLADQLGGVQEVRSALEVLERLSRRG